MGHYSTLEEEKQKTLMEKFNMLQEDKHQHTEHDNSLWHKEWEEFVSSTDKPDPVNHPIHYTSHSSRVECIQITEHMNFCLGNCLKYIWRAGLKGSHSSLLEDLKKAQFYLNREIARLEK